MVRAYGGVSESPDARMWNFTPPPGRLAQSFRVPGAMDVVAHLQHQLVELVAPALEAETEEAYVEVRNRTIMSVIYKIAAIGELTHTSEEVASTAFEEMADQAEQFGGYRWGDAVRDSARAILRASAIARKLQQIGFPHTPEEKERVYVYVCASMDWGWAFFCLSACMSHPHTTFAADMVLRQVMETATAAYSAVRTIEMEQEEATEVLPLGQMGDEECAIEKEAWCEGEQLLQHLEGRDATG